MIYKNKYGKLKVNPQDYEINHNNHAILLQTQQGQIVVVSLDLIRKLAKTSYRDYREKTPEILMNSATTQLQVLLRQWVHMLGDQIHQRPIPPFPRMLRTTRRKKYIYTKLRFISFVVYYLRHAECHAKSAESGGQVAPNDGHRSTIRVHESVVARYESQGRSVRESVSPLLERCHQAPVFLLVPQLIQPLLICIPRPHTSWHVRHIRTPHHRLMLLLLLLLRLHHLQISKTLLHLHSRQCNKQTSQQNHSTKCNKQTTTTTTNSILQRLWAPLLARYKNSLAATNRHFSAWASDHQRSLQLKKNHNNNNKREDSIPCGNSIP